MINLKTINILEIESILHPYIDNISILNKKNR